MDLNQLNELDLQNIGEWPGIAKAFLILLLCGSVAGAWYYFDSRDQLANLETVEKKELGLRKEFESKQQKAANLDAYRQQLAEMQESFGAMLRQLPDSTQVAALLVDVSQTGLAAGLEFELFQPLGEQKKEFYAELPIRIRVTGRYGEFGNFISGLAALPRIVTIHNLNIQNRKPTPGDDAPLSLDATVKTYRYLDEGSAQ
ncbi:MAG: type 4a pilus biogenesis protein PilO [Chromatiaceae bacterium]|nr:type 4a pilus biogenesis protein PilO [Chromatiaceae bacterium]